MTTKIKGRKSGSKKGHTPVESPDSAQSIARAKMLIALGEGEFAGGLTGQTIFFGDGTSYTPLQNADGSENFPGVVWEFRSGVQDQSYIQGFPGVENELTVGYELKFAVPYIRAISNTQLSAVRVRVGWATLLWQKDNGDKVGTRVEYAIDLSVDGGAYETVINGVVDDKATTLYERSHRINLPKATTGWQLRVRRVSPDATSINVVDTMKVQAVTEIIDAKLRYPHTALLYVEFDARQFPNGIPQVVCSPKGRIIRVPDTYDPETRTYSGTWTGTFKWAWTDNPAWIFYDIVLSERFGLGQRIGSEQLDRWELYRIAQYCDQLIPDGRGGMEPRHRCNVYIQDRADAWTVLRDLAARFRGMTYWGDNRMYVLADMPDDTSHIYNHANVVNGKFTFSDPSETTRYTTALVNWSDPKNHYKDTPEPVYDNDLAMRYDYRQIELTAIGCDRQSEANRHGRWILLTNGAGEVVTFDTGLDVPPVGKVIGVAANELAGRIIGGRISAVNGRTVKLDRAADVKPGDRLFVNLPSGSAQARTVQAVNGEMVTVTTPWSETPEAESNWAVEADDLYMALFRVTGVTDNNDGTYAVTGTTYNPDLYFAVDHGARLDERPISVIPPGVQAPPDNVSIDSYSQVSQGIAVTTMRVAWDSVSGAIAYEAEWRKDSGNWVSVPRTSTQGFEVPGIYAGRYLVRVRAVNAMDASSVWSFSDEVALTGKVGNPPKPVGLTASDNVVFGIELNWGFSENTGDTLKTEIQYSLTGTEDDAMLLADVPYPQRKYQQMGLKAGQIFWYRAQLIDRTGNESGFTDFVRGQASVDVSDITDSILEDMKDSEVFKDLMENAVDTSEKVAGMADDIKEQADALEQQAKDIQDNADGLAQAEVKIDEIALSMDGVTGQMKNSAIAIIQGNLAQVATRKTLSATVAGNSAQLDRIDQVIVDEKQATAQSLLSLQTDVAGNKASINSLSKTVSNYQQATATQINAITATVEGHTSSITTNANAIADVNGKMSAMYSIKVGLASNGQYYAAGMGFGVENTPSGMQSQVVFLADRFAVTTQAGAAVTLPFVIQNGQTFISQALIGKGWITNAMIGDFIQSDVYTPGSVGWHINKNGNSEFNNVTVRGTVYASDGEFTGKVRAKSFIGDIVNANVFNDIPEETKQSNGSVALTGSISRTYYFTDSATDSLSKTVIFDIILLSGMVTGSGSYIDVTININGTKKTTRKGDGGTVPVRFSVKGITTPNVTVELTLTYYVPAGAIRTITYGVSSPMISIVRGSGSFRE